VLLEQLRAILQDVEERGHRRARVARHKVDASLGLEGALENQLVPVENVGAAVAEEFRWSCLRHGVPFYLCRCLFWGGEAKLFVLSVARYVPPRRGMQPSAPLQLIGMPAAGPQAGRSGLVFYRYTCAMPTRMRMDEERIRSGRLRKNPEQKRRK